MSTPNINVLLTAALANYDNLAPNTPLLSNLNPGSQPFGATAYLYNEYVRTSVVVALPISPSYVLWVRNRDSSLPLIVIPNYTSGLVQTTQIGPGDLFLFYGASKNNGFTALTINGVGGNALFELYVAG